MNWWNERTKIGWLLVLAFASTPAATDFETLCTDRAAIERVYYAHRLGEKPPFEKTLPRETLKQLIGAEFHKEAVLKKVYGVELTPAMLEAEVQRINTTTRAPEILAELKAALGNDPKKFANTMARPIVVERELRQRFENDDALHASTRRECEHARLDLLIAKTNGASPQQLVARLQRTRSNHVTQATWQLGARAEEAPPAPTADEVEIRKRFGPAAKILSGPEAQAAGRKIYFDDLPAELRQVLRAQLREPGNVSAVIETPSAFLLYVVGEKTEAVLAVAALSLPKRSYEQWLEEMMVAPGDSSPLRKR